MKKFLIALFTVSVLVLLPQAAFADSGIAGQIYSTDILAYVNGKPIDGYNIGGRTVIIAEDLVDYGFTYTYDDESRVLRVASFFNDGIKEVAQIPRGKTGRILGNIYKTDIKVYFNGNLVTGYNIGGRTAICIEELGDLTDSPNAFYGYSQYLGKSIWNPEEKTISFESYIRNEDEILGLSRVYHRFKDNVIYTYSDDFYAKSEFSAEENGVYVGQYTYSAGMGVSKYLVKPLYFDNHGELVEIGLCVQNPNNTANDALIHINDPESVKEMIKTFKTPKKSHDEAVEYFTSICKNIQKIENDRYTVLMGEHETEGILFVNINKQGGYVVDTFFNSYKDREIKFGFEKSPVNSGPNTVWHSVYPFGGPHGTTVANFMVDLDNYDYE